MLRIKCGCIDSDYSLLFVEMICIVVTFIFAIGQIIDWKDLKDERMDID